MRDDDSRKQKFAKSERFFRDPDLDLVGGGGGTLVGCVSGGTEEDARPEPNTVI